MKKSILLFFALFLCESVHADLPMKIQGTDLLTGKSTQVEFTSSPRATVITFLSAKCPCSASHESGLEALRMKYEPLGFRFVAVHSNQDENSVVATEHFRASPLKLSIIKDEGAKIADTFGALKTPHVFVLDSKREILFQGGVDDCHQAAEAKKHYLADALASIQSGRRPEISKARTLGCVISRK